MEIYQLRSLLATAEMGNFTRAAKRLSITQPALSQQIINLEKELGQKLFHRLGRRAVLTEAGKVFIERARAIVFEVDSAAKELRDHPGMERRITVGAIPSVAPYILPALIAQARIEHPNLEIQTREDFRPQLVRGVLDGDLDVAITSTPVIEPTVSVEPFFQEPLLLVVGKQHRFNQLPAVRAGDLAGETFVLLGSASSVTERVREFCGDHRIEPRIAHRCAQLATVKSLVALGVGISILPRIAQSSKDAETLNYLRLADSRPVRELVIVRHQQRYQSRGGNQFLAMLRAGAPVAVAH